VRHSAEASILGNGQQSRFGKANQSVRPWAALRHHSAPKAKAQNNPIPHYDYWAHRGGTYQLQTRENETIEPHLHTCFPADRRSAEWDHQRDVASQEALSMRVQKQILDVEFAIFTTMPKITSLERKLSLAMDSEEQSPLVKFRLDRIDCVFTQSRVPLRPACVEHLSRSEFNTAQTFHPGGVFYAKCQAAGDHPAQLAYVHKYHQLAEGAKAHLAALQELWDQVCKDTHARVEQQRLLDDLEVKRMAVYNPCERDQKLRALFHTFDLDGNGMVDKDEFFTIGQSIYGVGNWTRELNDAGFALVDKDDSAEIDEDEFVFIFTSNMNNMRDELFDKMVNTYAERATIAGEYMIRDRENVRCRS